MQERKNRVKASAGFEGFFIGAVLLVLFAGVWGTFFVDPLRFLALETSFALSPWGRLDLILGLVLVVLIFALVASFGQLTFFAVEETPFLEEDFAPFLGIICRREGISKKLEPWKIESVVMSWLEGI